MFRRSFLVLGFLMGPWWSKLHRIGTDIIPTILNLFRLETRHDFDGAVVILTTYDTRDGGHSRHEHITSEYWRFALTGGRYEVQGDSGCLDGVSKWIKETTIKGEKTEQLAPNGINIPTKPLFYLR